jgi:hypothetical protein
MIAPYKVIALPTITIMMVSFSFLLLKAIAKRFPLVFIIAFQIEKERQPSRSLKE